MNLNAGVGRVDIRTDTLVPIRAKSLRRGFKSNWAIKAIKEPQQKAQEFDSEEEVCRPCVTSIRIPR